MRVLPVGADGNVGTPLSGPEAGPAPICDYLCVGGMMGGWEFCNKSLCTFRQGNLRACPGTGFVILPALQTSITYDTHTNFIPGINYLFLNLY